MTFKKVSIITIAGAALLAGAIGIAMSLTSPNEMEIEVPEAPVEQGTEITEEGIKTLENMENMPIYFDDQDKLLLPLRNVMEGLGGSVKWNGETRAVEVSYRGRTLAVQPGEKEATLNGYEVTLPEAVEMINGCLYADEKVISAYYTGEVDFNHETRQVTLQTKDNTVPVLAMKEISGKKEGKSYTIEVPVIVGLNDGKYEASLNDKNMQEMQAYADDFMTAEAKEDGDGLLQLRVKTGMYTKDFLSIWWEGTKDGVSVKFAKNFDLMGQKTVTLADMLTEASLEEMKAVAGEGWTEDRFCLTSEGGLVLLKGSNESSLEMHHWTTEGKQPVWKDSYKALLHK
ncbi:copper amine oxidase N-terminal domain-containing protein [Anaerotignum sp.]|nr:copper amine oxidase N-terminal domain-containing protein [Anaerotignum sp.]MBQ7759445.1 copper amine oxidase N-terminal domain-containing protein [Anaerotignum sp.]